MWTRLWHFIVFVWNVRVRCTGGLRANIKHGATHGNTSDKWFMVTWLFVGLGESNLAFKVIKKKLVSEFWRSSKSSHESILEISIQWKAQPPWTLQCFTCTVQFTTSVSFDKYSNYIYKRSKYLNIFKHI